jgi:hypothetical protein
MSHIKELKIQERLCQKIKPQGIIQQETLARLKSRNKNGHNQKSSYTTNTKYHQRKTMVRGAPARQRATSGIEATRTQPVTLSSTSRDYIQNVQTAPTTSDTNPHLTNQQNDASGTQGQTTKPSERQVATNAYQAFFNTLTPEQQLVVISQVH